MGRVIKSWTCPLVFPVKWSGECKFVIKKWLKIDKSLTPLVHFCVHNNVHCNENIVSFFVRRLEGTKAVFMTRGVLSFCWTNMQLSPRMMNRPITLLNIHFLFRWISFKPIFTLQRSQKGCFLWSNIFSLSGDKFSAANFTPKRSVRNLNSQMSKKIDR